MKKSRFLILFVLIFSMALTSCSANTIDPANSNSNSEEITDIEAKELFERASVEIITLASEDPTLLVKMILGDDIEVIYKETDINGAIYYETTATYKKMSDYYSKLFTKDALDWVLSTKFADVNGTLYCSPVGGASGWSIANLKVAKISQDDNKCVYEATFNEFEQTTTSLFTVETTDSGYKISNIDYIPDLLKVN